MPKNLVILHLESISNTILWQYRVELATIWRLMQSSFRYTRFYTAATSTKMAIDYALRGNPCYRDTFSSFLNDSSRTTPYTSAEIGYHLVRNNYIYDQYLLDYLNSTGNDKDGVKYRYFQNDPQILLSIMRDNLRKYKQTGQPFFGYVNNNVSHMAFDDGNKLAAETFSERFRAGYLAMDGFTNQVLALLMEAGVWDDTLIVAYGDHGDELWSHGLNKGYCHVIQPYASLVWTPLFIYESGKPDGDDDRLISSIDIKETVLRRILPDYAPPANLPLREGIFPGINFDEEKRDLAFSQNLYALQLEYNDWEKALTKGYAVTDGDYRLVVSSGGKKVKNGGLELYCDRVDPTNSRNLLDFFTLNLNGDIVAFYPPPEATSEDFLQAFNPEAVEGIINTYQYLKKELYDYIRQKESDALKFSSGQSHVMPEAVFKYARKRIRPDFNE